MPGVDKPEYSRWEWPWRSREKGKEPSRTFLGVNHLGRSSSEVVDLVGRLQARWKLLWGPVMPCGRAESCVEARRRVEGARGLSIVFCVCFGYLWRCHGLTPPGLYMYGHLVWGLECISLYWPRTYFGAGKIWGRLMCYGGVRTLGLPIRAKIGVWNSVLKWNTWESNPDNTSSNAIRAFVGVVSSAISRGGSNKNTS